MNRTQIYLDSQLSTQLKFGADLNKMSMSAYIRQLLKQSINNNRTVKTNNPLLKLAKLAQKQKITGKKTNVSGNFDKYLPKQWR